MDDDPNPKGGPSAMVPVAIGLVGVVLGAAALFFSLNDRSASEKSGADLKAAVDTATAQAQAVDKRVADLEGRFSALAQGNDNLGTRIQSVATQVQDALNRMGAVINDDHVQIKAQGDALQQLVAKSGPAAPAKSSAAADSGAPAAPGTPGVYVIASGDTFGSLARKNGVTVSAIEAANPEVNPNRLQIGQKITIPAAAAKTPAPPAPAASAAAPPAAAAAPAATPPATPAATTGT